MRNGQQGFNPSFMGNPWEVDEAIGKVQKAISSTNVSDLLLVREDLSAELAISAPTDTPIRNRLQRIEGNGSAHSWYKLVPTITDEGKFMGTKPSNGFFARGGLPNATQADYVFMSAPYVSVGDIAEVTFFAQMAGKKYTDNKALQIKVKMLNAAMMEEWAIINGDSSSGAGLQFDGLDKLITSNVTDLSGVSLTLAAITATMKNVVNLGGKPQFGVFSLREIGKITDLVLGSYYRMFQAGAGSMADIPAGIAITKWVSPYGTISILGSRYIAALYGNTKAYICDDVSMTEDGNAITMVDLMPVSSIDLALTATAYRTLIAEFTVLMMTIEAFQGKIINIGA